MKLDAELKLNLKVKTDQSFRIENLSMDVSGTQTITPTYTNAAGCTLSPASATLSANLGSTAPFAITVTPAATCGIGSFDVSQEWQVVRFVFQYY